MTTPHSLDRAATPADIAKMRELARESLAAPFHHLVVVPDGDMQALIVNVLNTPKTVAERARDYLQ